MATQTQRVLNVQEVAGEILARLQAEFGGKISADGKYWQAGRCPSCGKKSLWTLADKPLQPRCNHEAKCGHSFNSREHYPDLFADISTRYQPTPTNPNSTADAYMRIIRGFPSDQLQGWYQQDKYWNPRGDRGTATVQFWLDKERRIGWEKFIDLVTVTDDDGEQKSRDSRFIGKYQGLAWTPPNFLIEVGEPVYLVEGIFDAIALYLNGYRSVAAIMACGNFPTELINTYRDSGAVWTLALDADRAGHKATKKHIEKLDAMGLKWACIQPSKEPSKRDWNDLHLSESLQPKDMGRYRYYGQLLTARSAEEAALATWRHSKQSFFVFDHGRQMYGFQMDLKAYEKALEKVRVDMGLVDGEPISNEQRDAAMQESKAIQRLANCQIRFRYTQRNPVDERLSYFFRVEFPDGRVSTGKMKAADTVGAAEFRKQIADIAPGGLIKAKSDAHEWLLDRWFRDILNIETIAYAGYVDRHRAYVYPKFAAQDGKIYHRNDDEYIRFGPELAIKSDFHDVEIEPNFDLDDYRDDWAEDLYLAWGVKGIVALAYFTASLICTQVRQQQTSFMFLELVGEAGTGKSTLLEFLWRLFGRKGNYEGFDPSSSTNAFTGRALASVSNLPTVFIEADRIEGKRGKKQEFDWENLKKLYGGKSPYNRAIATAGNETYAPPYQGSLVVAQNAPVDASEAVLSRLCHLFFKRDECTPETFEAARRLEGLPAEQLSGYLVRCLMQVPELEKQFFARQLEFERQIREQPWAKTVRIGFNHSQLAAAVHLLKLTCPALPESIVYETIEYVMGEMPKQREAAIKQDHPMAQQFFDVIAYLEEQGEALNHSSGKADPSGTVAYRINEVYQNAHRAGQQLPPELELKKALKASRRFIASNKSTSSIIANKSVRCWHFKAQA